MPDSKQRLAAALVRDGIIGPDIPLDSRESWLLDAATNLLERGTDPEAIRQLAIIANSVGRFELDRVLADLRDGVDEADALEARAARQTEITRLLATVRHIRVAQAVRDQSEIDE